MHFLDGVSCGVRLSMKMAQALFDALAGNVTSMDSQTALAVQSLLESQTVHETTPQMEEEDVFQCGKCKKQFTSLGAFVDHKQSRCIPLMPRTTLHQSTAGSAFTASIPHAIHRQPMAQQSLQSFSTGLSQPSLTQLTSNMVLTDEQMLTFGGVDQSALLHTSTFQLTGNPTVQATGPFLSQVTHLTPRVSNNVTILSPIQSTATLASNGSAFTSTVNNLQPLLQQHVQPITIATLPEKPQTVIKPSPTKAGRKTAQANLISVLDGENGTLKQRRSRTAGMTQIDDSLGRKKLRCQYCDKAFSKNFDLQQHIRSHTGERPFQCIVCGRAFAQKSNVKKHMSTHKVWPGGPGKTLPNQPPAEIIVEPIISTQEITAEEDNTVEGSTNGSTQDLLPSQSDSSLQQSEETQEGFSGYVTLDDGQLQQEQQQSLQHEEQEPSQQTTVDGITHLGDSDIKKDLKLKVVIDNTYLCQYCNQKFETYFKLKSHMTQHKNEQVYKCVMKSCNATFKDLDSFLDHTSTHKEEMTYRCHHCNKFFSTLYELGVHQYSHSLFPSQGPKAGPRHFQCNKCMNKYSTPEALEHHMTKTLHSFNCPHCEKVFTCERYLRRHLPTHGTEGQFKCDICQKAFKTEHYLKMHHFIHSGEKPFVCEICGAAFNRKDKLKRHDAIHNKKIRFKCPFKAITGCSKEFNRPDKLKAHIISHSGVKPFVCPDCGKGFARRPHLQEHIKAHRAEFKFKCEHCGRGFFRSKLFNDHKCKPRKDGQPRVFKPRLYKRKAGRPRRKMITVTEEMVKQNAENREPKKRGRPRLHPVAKENKNDASKHLQGNVALSENASLEQSAASNSKGDKTISKSVHLGSIQTSSGVYMEPSSDGMEMSQTDYSESNTDNTYVTNESEVEIFKHTLTGDTDSDLDPKHSDRPKPKKSKVECYVRTAPPMSVVEHFVTVHLTNAAHGSGNAIQTHLIPTGTTTQILSPSSHTAFQPITIIEAPTVHITVPASVSDHHDQIAALTTSASMEGIPVDIVTVSEDHTQEITAVGTGPTYVTCEETMEDYVAETGDPVLQGTESLLNASAEILRSAQHTSEHQL